MSGVLMRNKRRVVADAVVTNVNNKILKKNESYIFENSICVCMVLKNTDEYFDEIRANIGLIRSWFRSVFLVLVNANSSDNTHVNFKNFPESILLDTVSDDPEVHKNLYLNTFYNTKESFDLLMVVDPMISLRTTLKLKSFDFLTPEKIVDWDVCFANQSYKYYDLNNLVLDDNNNTINGMVHIPSNSGHIRVKSAFGGWAVYKTHVFGGSPRYTSDCHKSFNLHISSSRQVKMFIISDFIIETSPKNSFLYL
jgi:hypothetical protein